MLLFFKHLALWTMLVPWAASTAWLLWDFAVGTGKGWVAGVASLPIFMLGGLCGILFCALVTFPLALLSYAILAQFADALRKRGARVACALVTSMLGAGFAGWATKLLNTGRPNCTLVIIGFIAGLSLGLGTVRLWLGQKHENDTGDAGAGRPTPK